jgi:hypothetical protein
MLRGSSGLHASRLKKAKPDAVVDVVPGVRDEELVDEILARRRRRGLRYPSRNATVGGA